MSAIASISQKLFTALQAYVLSLDYAKRKVNPEEWETHIDWARLEADARTAMEEFAAGPHEEVRRWVMSVVVLSTDHLPQDTYRKLRNAFDEEYPDVIPFRDGFIVYTGEDADSIDEDFPEDLKKCVHWAIKNGYSHVRFDPDGDIIPELRDYEE